MDLQRSSVSEENKHKIINGMTLIKILITITIYVVIVVAISSFKNNKKELKINARWVHNVDGTWSYSVDGENIFNKLYEIDGKVYYFDWKGIMQTNMFKDSYYLGKDGAAVTNQWKENIIYWHYYGEDGKYYIDKFLLYNNEWYYFDKTGRMVENKWIDYKGKKYYFGKNGVMLRSQYIKLGKDGVGYLTEEGSLLTNGRIDKYIADLDGYLTVAP